MHQRPLSNGKDTSTISGLVLKMMHVHYFAYILFHAYLKVIELVLLEIKLNKLAREKMIAEDESRTL